MKQYGKASGRFQNILSCNRGLVTGAMLVQLLFAYAVLQSSPYILLGPLPDASELQPVSAAVSADRITSISSRPDRPKASVFILVKTIPSAHGRRKVMRETWLSELAKTDPETPHIMYRFFSETPEPDLEAILKAEMETYGDIVALDDLMQQAHRKIGAKMVRSFMWIVDNYDATHVVMVDDDCYVNLKRLQEDWQSWAVRRCVINIQLFLVPTQLVLYINLELSVFPVFVLFCIFDTHHAQTSMHYMGYHMLGNPVIKVPAGHTHVGKYGEHHRFPVNNWPRYASGPFYALSADLLEPFINPPLPLRDMSSNDAMTGAVLLPYPVHYETREGFFMWGHTIGKACIPAEKLYAIHVTPRTYGGTDLWLNRNTTWSSAIHHLHDTVVAGQCIQGFT